MRVSPLLFLAAAPAATHASGDDVLSLFWLEFLLFVAVCISLFVGGLTRAGKAAVFAAYFVGAAIPWQLTANWPYTENLVLINSLCVGVPLVFWFVALLAVRKKCGKHNNSLQARRP